MSLDIMKLKYSQPPIAVPLQLDNVNYDSDNGNGDPSVGQGLVALSINIPAGDVRLYSAIRIQMHRAIAGDALIKIRTYVDAVLKTALFVHNSSDSPFIDLDLIQMMTPGARWYFYNKSAVTTFEIKIYSADATVINYTVSAFYLSG